MHPNWFVALRAATDDPLELPPLADGMRPLHPDDYHVTVAFFGALPADPTDRLAAMIEGMRRPPLEAVADRALLLPRPAHASVVALHLQGDALTDYIATWRDRLRAAVGLQPEARSVLPHMTVVRMTPTRDRNRIEQRLHWAAQLQRRLPLRLRLTSVGLYTWRERPLSHQPRYKATLCIAFD